MLPRENRLTKKRDFDAVFLRGKSVKDGFLAAKILRTNAKTSRFGFVVSKKISAKATVRNKVKRRLRKIIEDAFVEIKKPVDIIFITLPGIQKQEFTRISQSVINILKRI